jgi:hypothetical protein
MFVMNQHLPTENIGPIINSLVSLDLAVLPLLANKMALHNRIIEINAHIQNSKIVSPSPLELQQKLRHEIERIDPLEVDGIMEILRRDLNITEVSRALASKSLLATRYNAAKKELIRREIERENDKVSSSSRSSTFPTLSSSTYSFAIDDDKGQKAQEAPMNLALDELTVQSLYSDCEGYDGERSGSTRSRDF